MIDHGWYWLIGKCDQALSMALNDGHQITIKCPWTDHYQPWWNIIWHGSTGLHNDEYSSKPQYPAWPSTIPFSSIDQHQSFQPTTMSDHTNHIKQFGPLSPTIIKHNHQPHFLARVNHHDLTITTIPQRFAPAAGAASPQCLAGKRRNFQPWTRWGDGQLSIEGYGLWYLTIYRVVYDYLDDLRPLQYHCL